MLKKSGRSVGKLLAATLGAMLLSMAATQVMGPAAAFAFTPWYAYGGSHTVVLNPDGTVWALGRNGDGQLGNGRFGGQSDEPLQVKGLSNITAVAAKGTTSVALHRDGTVWTWGNNASGQLGDGTTLSRARPVQVSGLSGVAAIAAGAAHVLALKTDGTVWTWGSNSSGQLGNELKNRMETTPQRVKGLHGITAIAAGAFHSAALKGEGSVWTWGSNSTGQLGTDTVRRSAAPLQVSGLTAIKAIAAGNYHVAVLQADGTVAAWGSNYYRQLGSNSVRHGSATPMTVSGISGATDLTARMNHTVALMTNGSVWAWGDENAGQWGNGVSMDGSSSPVQVCGVNSLTTIAAVGNPATLQDGGIAATRRHLIPDDLRLLAADRHGRNTVIAPDLASLQLR